MIVKGIVVVVAALILSGCIADDDGPMKVVSTVTPFHRIATADIVGKKVAILAYPPERQLSLEFEAYRDKIKAKFESLGIVVVDTAAQADWLAFFSYGIDDGTQRSEVVSSPVFGQTGGGTAYHSGSIIGPVGQSATYGGTSYTMPTYGVTGYRSDTISVTTFRRNLALDIVDRASFDKGAPAKLYEGRLISRGSCGALAGVFDPLVTALFQNWPGPSGQPRTIEVEMTGQC